MSDFWVGDRATSPPMVEMIATENRRISVGLGSALTTGESVQPGTVTAEVRNWRTHLLLDPDPIVSPLTYEPTNKIAMVKVDASRIPRSTNCALVISFDITGPSGAESRAVYTGLWVAI